MNAPTKFGLSHSVISQMTSIFSKYPEIEKVLLYGSRAKGIHKHGSDIDLTVVGRGLSLTDLMKIETELDDLLLPYKIDLSLYHQIDNEALLEHIARVGTPFYPE